MSSAEPKAADRSLGELFGEMSSNLSALIRKEMELARVELKEEAVEAGKAGGRLGGGAFVGYLAVLLLSFALAWGLNDAFDNSGWLGFAIVGVLYGIVAAVLLNQGRQKLKEINPVPEQTVATLKEDVQWAKEQKS
jgi:putative superfamily III holin-X